MKSWTFVCRFTNEEDALTFTNQENCWSLKNTNTTEEGKIKYFGCKNVKSRGIQCDSALKLIFDSNSTDIIIHRTTLNHNCDTIDSKCGNGLPKQIKTDIQIYLKMKLKPKTVLEQLKEKYPDHPINIIQVKNYMFQYKKSICGSMHLS